MMSTKLYIILGAVWLVGLVAYFVVVDTIGRLHIASILLLIVVFCSGMLAICKNVYNKLPNKKQKIILILSNIILAVVIAIVISFVLK